MKNLLKLLTTLCCLLVFISGLVACDLAKDPADKAKLEFNDETMQLEILDEIELQYTYTGKKQLVWSVDNATIASVDNGVLVALKDGQATITVSDGKVRDTLAVSVNVVNSNLLNISVDGTQLSMFDTETHQLQPVLNYNGKSVADAQFSYESSDSEIVQVSSTGELLAKSIGETEILISSNFLGVNTGTIVTVSVEPSGKVVLNKQSITLDAVAEFNGNSFVNQATIVASVTEKGLAKDKATVNWSSNNNNVATVEDGVITGVAIGTTEIVASYVGEDGNTVSAVVMVVVNPVATTLTDKVDVVKTEPLSIDSYFQGVDAKVSRVYLTDGILNDELTFQSGKVSFSNSGFMGDATLVLESDKLLLQVPVCVWTALISSTSEFETLLTATEGYYRLTEDLDLSEVEWSNESSIVFKGVLDGNGKTLTNFAPSGRGLFDVLGNGAKVANLVLENAVVGVNNLSTGILASSVKENANVEIDSIVGNIVINGNNCGGLFGLLYGNSQVTVKNCSLYVYASDVSQAKGALVGSADGIVNLPDDASSTFITSLKLCGNQAVTGVENSASGSINLVETTKPVALEELNYFDLAFTETTLVEIEVSNVAKVTVFGNTVETVGYENNKIGITKEQIEGYAVNSLEVVFETDTGAKSYYAIPIVIGELKIYNSNKELLKSVPKGTLVLQEDIDLAGITWDSAVTFSGTLDGGNHVVKNLTVESKNGFFKNINGATIKNVGFVDVDLSKGDNGALTYQPSGSFTVNNVFIEVVSTNALGRVGAICERSNSANVIISLTDVVISMPNRNSNEAIFGYLLKGYSPLANVHCIGLPNESASVGNVPGNGVKGTYTFYSDMATFATAKTTLTPFLDDCVEEYFNIVKISQTNVGDLLTLKGNETVILAEDIDLAGITWNSAVTFTGTFDGNNHVVKNLTAESSNGFFKNINGATIKNVGFADVDLSKGNNGALTYQPSGSFTVNNVFIEVVSTNAGGRVGAICERSTSEAVIISLTDVVISMPNRNSNEAICGFIIKGYSTWTNVHCIGLPNESASVGNVAGNGIKGTYTLHPDLATFNSATKTLTAFLTSCVDTYLNVKTEA